MSQVHIIATFFPKAGKVDRMRELLCVQCREVQEREPYALRFLLTEENETATPLFCLFETYDSAAATEQHLVQPHFQQMMSAMNEEGLMAQKPNVIKTSTVGGFDLDPVLYPA